MMKTTMETPQGLGCKPQEEGLKTKIHFKVCNMWNDSGGV